MAAEKTPDTPDSEPTGIVPRHLDPTEVPELLEKDSALAAVLQGISTASGEDCFRAITEHLARALAVAFAVVTEYLPESESVRSLAFFRNGGFIENSTWTLAGTPCRRVIDGEFTLHSAGLPATFPEDAALVELGAESYLGFPLHGPDRAVIGHLFVMDTKPMPALPRNLAIFRIFAARAASELVRLRLERSLAESEERFRDLFDEAPIAYVHEGLDSRFIRANRTAMRILGITPDQVQGTYGKTFIPDTPEAQARLREAFDSIQRGIDTSGVVLELRRRDNGQPIWIQWWSRPDPGGSFTRTMFLDITDRVLMDRAKARLEAENTYLSEEIRSAHHYGDIVGRSPALLRVLEQANRVAATDSTVLIQGETGTGKELVARALHDQSQRRKGPFVKVNCAALPAGLVESEFFGHEKGAFTGAVAARRGRFELADHGTIFLDEVGEVTPEVQVKLLRVLQENEFERVGGTRTMKVDVRVIAATNRDLAAEVQAGRFRADLYYRLSVFPLRMPPLRDRREDIPVLAAYFVTQLATAMGKRIDGIAADTLERLSRYSWPGNIRELRNVLERAIIVSTSPLLRIDGDELLPAPTAEKPSRLQTLEDLKRQHIEAVLKETGGASAGPKGAAKILGVPPSTLRSRMARFGIKG